MAEAQYFTNEVTRRKYKTRQVLGQVFLYAFLTIFALFLVTPFIFMVVFSFMNPDSFYQFTTNAKFDSLRIFGDGKLLIGTKVGDNWSLQNFKEILVPTIEDSLGNVHSTSFFLYFFNTIIVAVSSTTVTVVTAVLAAFAFARLEFKGKDVLFALLLATMMIPGEMMVITNYQTTKELHWEFTFAALIFVHGVSVFYIYYLRQTFQQIPNELYLAAKVDGVGDIGYLFKVMIPIAMPTITTIIILSLMGAWNSYIWPSLVANGNWLQNGIWIPLTKIRLYGLEDIKNSFFANQPIKMFKNGYNMRLVSNGLMSIFGNAGDDVTVGKEAIKIAGSMVVTAPLFVFFLIFRKYIMKGLSRSGIKG